MLISFEIENYRSIKERQTLLMTASNYYLENEESLIDENLLGLVNTRLVPVCAIFGANASGKTTIIRAMDTLRDMVFSSFSRPAGQGLVYMPHVLSSETATKPTSYFVAFISGGTRYEYSLSHDATKVLSEKLYAYPKGRPQKWFIRTWNKETQISEFDINSSRVKLPKNFTQFVRNDALLLSAVSRLSSSSLRPVFDWFNLNQLIVLNRGIDAGSFTPQTAFALLEDSSKPPEQKQFLELLRVADFGVKDVRVEEESFAGVPQEIEEMLSQQMVDQLKASRTKTAILSHYAEGGAIKDININEESAGTKQFFVLVPVILAALKLGSVVFLDEIDTSMHPLLTRQLISLFVDPESNPNHAQLIFTAHDTSLLNGDFLRRDEVWFTTKRSNGSTLLEPLSDYSPRKDEALAGGYLAGRYDAIPDLRDFTDFVNPGIRQDQDV